MNPSEQEPSVPLDTWKTLHDLTSKVYAMKPWEWMEEINVFGVRDATDGTTLFVSVMGMLGEHHAVAIYPNAESLAGFWAMQAAASQEVLAQRLFMTYHVQASLGAKKELLPPEKAIAQQLKVRPAGSHAWPMFRSYRPGWAPWPVNAQEARWTKLALEQLLHVAPRFLEAPDLLDAKVSDDHYLVRQPTAASQEAAWSDTFEEFVLHEEWPQASLEPDIRDELRTLPQEPFSLEVDVMPSMTLIGPRSGRPASPFIFLAVVQEAGAVVAFELMDPEGPVGNLWLRLPSLLARSMRKVGARPAWLCVRSRLTQGAVEPACRQLGIPLRIDAELPALTEAYESLLDHLSGAR